MKRVVIIGGGFAGSTLAKKIESKFEVTLIDNKDYFEFTPGILRTIVNPDRSACMQVKHSDYLKNSKFVQGEVKAIDEKEVSVSGLKIPYDYLVLAMGSSYQAPFKHPHLFVASRAKELASYSKDLSSAEDVLIMGGGLVGVELAAEIAHYNPEKKLTVINVTPELLGRMSPKARNIAKNFLEKRGAKLIFGEKIVKTGKKEFITDKGNKIKADLAFACLGIVPNSAILKKNFASSLDERGFAKVDEYLRLTSHENIYVAGDLTGIIEEKTAQNAERHARLIANNILAAENGQAMTKYESASGPIVLSLGPHNAIFAKGDFVFSGIIPAMLKWAVEKKEMFKKRF